MSQSGGLLCSPLRVEFTDLLDHDLATVWRERVFVKPLGTNQYRPAGKKGRAADAENQALHKPCAAFFGLSWRGISKRQARQHKHPPSQLNAVQRDIHKAMQHRRQRSGNDTPAQRPGTGLSQAKNIPDKEGQQRQGEEKRGNTCFGGQHEPVALRMNRHRLIDARLHIERKNIAKCPKSGSREWVISNDMQRI